MGVQRGSAMARGNVLEEHPLLQRGLACACTACDEDALDRLLHNVQRMLELVINLNVVHGITEDYTTEHFAIE